MLVFHYVKKENQKNDKGKKVKQRRTKHNNTFLLFVDCSIFDTFLRFQKNLSTLFTVFENYWFFITFLFLLFEKLVVVFSFFSFDFFVCCLPSFKTFLFLFFTFSFFSLFHPSLLFTFFPWTFGTMFFHISPFCAIFHLCHSFFPVPHPDLSAFQGQSDWRTTFVWWIQAPPERLPMCGGPHNHVRLVCSAMRGNAQFACVLELLSRVLPHGHRLAVLTVQVHGFLGHSHVSGVVASAVALVTNVCWCRFQGCHTDVVVFCCLQPSLGEIRMLFSRYFSCGCLFLPLSWPRKLGRCSMRTSRFFRSGSTGMDAVLTVSQSWSTTDSLGKDVSLSSWCVHPCWWICSIFFDLISLSYFGTVRNRLAGAPSSGYGTVSWSANLSLELASPAVADAFKVIVQNSRRTCRCRIHISALWPFFSENELSHPVFAHVMLHLVMHVTPHIASQSRFAQFFKIFFPFPLFRKTFDISSFCNLFSFFPTFWKKKVQLLWLEKLKKNVFWNLFLNF